MAKLYDCVDLTAPAGDWPAGARGHLIEIYPNGMGLVEIEGAAESALTLSGISCRTWP